MVSDSDFCILLQDFVERLIRVARLQLKNNDYYLNFKLFLRNLDVKKLCKNQQLQTCLNKDE